MLTAHVNTLTSKACKIPYMKTVGERIVSVREALGLTQQEMAARIKVSRPAVAQWESGDSKSIKSENLFKIEKAFGISAEWLATGKGNKTIGQVSELPPPHYGPTPAALALANRIDQLPPILHPPVIATLEVMEAFARAMATPAPASGVDDATVDKIAALLLEQVKANRANMEKGVQKKKQSR